MISEVFNTYAALFAHAVQEGVCNVYPGIDENGHITQCYEFPTIDQSAGFLLRVRDDITLPPIFFYPVEHPERTYIGIRFATTPSDFAEMASLGQSSN